MKALGRFLLDLVCVVVLIALILIIAGSTGAAFAAFGPLVGVVVAFLWIAAAFAVDKTERL